MSKRTKKATRKQKKSMNPDGLGNSKYASKRRKFRRGDNPNSPWKKA